MINALLSSLKTAQPIEGPLAEIIEMAIGRLERGLPVDVEAYAAAYPEYAIKLREILPAAVAMVRLGSMTAEWDSSKESVDSRTSDTRDSGRGLDRSSSRLEVRCPNCHQPTRISADTTLSNLTCSACGSNFSLVDQSDVTDITPTLMTLGRFELVERLGMGSFGTVWKARDKELDRTVAIKIPRADRITADEQEKFFREARAVAQLRHPNIVSVHEVGRDGDSVYIVSDFVRGVTLSDWLTGQQPTGRESAELCAIIADALHHAHEQGVVHRDLKPANIMIDGDGDPHLMDFGLARREAGEVTMTMDGHILGTPAYMSPEQAEGKGHAADRRSDVYSLGVILFQLLTGELPFRGNARMLIHQVINDQPPSPRKLNGNIKRDLETIALKCLEKSPTARFPTAAEVADELRRFLRGEPIHARPIGRVGQLARWAKRKPASAAFASLLVVATVVSTWLAVRAMRAERLVVYERDQVLMETKQKEIALEQARNSAQTAEERLAANFITAGDAALAAGQSQARESYREALKLARKLRLSEFPAATGLMASYATQSAPLIGDDGNNGGVRGFELPSKASTIVRFAPDGHSAISASSDGSLILWDIRTGTPLRTFTKTNGRFADVAFSADGRLLITAGGDRLVRLWDVGTGKQIRAFIGHSAEVRSVAFSPNGQQAASASFDRTVRLWDLASGREVRRLDAPSYLHSVAYSPNSEQVISGGEPNKIVVWEVATGQNVRTLSDSAVVASVAISPDGKTLLSGSWGRGMTLWDLGSGAVVRRFVGHTATVTNVLFSPDGRAAVSASNDDTVRLWDVATAEELAIFHAHRDGVQSISISPDGRFVLSADARGTIKLWNLQVRNERSVFSAKSNNAVDIRAARDGTMLLSGNYNTLRLWDIATGQCIRAISAGSSTIWGIDLSPDGTKALTSHRDGTLTLWDLQTGGAQRKLAQHTDIATAVSFAPDGRSAMSASADGTLKLWDLQSGDVIRTYSGHQAYVRDVEILPDGKRALSASKDNTIKLWDVATGSVLHTFAGHGYWVKTIAPSQDGQIFASGSWDHRCGIWDLANNRNLFFTDKSQDIVTGVALSPDAKLLLSADTDGSITFWDIEKRQRIREFRQYDGDATCVTFCPDGATAFSGGRGPIRRWQMDIAKTYADFADSLSSAREVIARDPDDAGALALFGKWYLFRRIDDWAVELLEKARDRGAKISSLDLARSYWRLGKHVDATREFRRAIEQKEAPANYLSLCLQAVTTPADKLSAGE